MNIIKTIIKAIMNLLKNAKRIFSSGACNNLSILFTGGFGAVNLANLTTYYFSNIDLIGTSPNYLVLGFGRTTTIKKVVLSCNQTTNYSNESVSLYLRVNGTTDYLITNTLDLSTVGMNTGKVFWYDVNIAITDTDSYELKVVTPTFSTPGATSRWHKQLLG